MLFDLLFYLSSVSIILLSIVNLKWIIEDFDDAAEGIAEARRRLDLVEIEIDTLKRRQNEKK